jgi:hypothetical protein
VLEPNGTYTVNWQALRQHVTECDRHTLVSVAIEISKLLEAIEQRMNELAVTWTLAGWGFLDSAALGFGK